MFVQRSGFLCTILWRLSGYLESSYRSQHMRMLLAVLVSAKCFYERFLGWGYILNALLLLSRCSHIQLVESSTNNLFLVLTLDNNFRYRTMTLLIQALVTRYSSNFLYTTHLPKQNHFVVYHFSYLISYRAQDVRFAFDCISVYHLHTS